MEIRMATKADLDALVENRIDFITSLRAMPDLEALRHSTRAYLQEHLEDGALLCWLCTEDGKIRSSCLMCLYQTIPSPSAPNGKCGLLLNVYTLKEFRRQGLARELLTRILEQARGLGVSKVHLNATEDGRPLYESLGFSPLDGEMILKL